VHGDLESDLKQLLKWI